MRYSLVVVGAVGDFWRSKTMTAPVDPVETIFWHRRLTTKTLPRATIGARYSPTFHRTLRLRLQRRVRRSPPFCFPRSSSGSLAKFAAMLRASSLVSSLAAHGGQETRSQYAGPC